MAYTVGDRKVSLHGTITEDDARLILKRIDMFKICLNSSSFGYLMNLRKVINLYGDVLTIYSTLLNKIPNYDDITRISIKVCDEIMNLEQDFNRLFENVKFTWTKDKSYEVFVKKLCLLCVNSAVDTFDKVFKTLDAIDFFFNKYNNLEKLLIPCLYNQTGKILASLKKSSYLFSLTTVADDLHTIHELSPGLIKNLKKIEKLTLGIDRESLLLETTFSTFDPSLVQYTSILLGTAILKREIAVSQCQLIKRRDICQQASEHVVSIPLTEEQASKFSKKMVKEYFTWIIVSLFVLISVVIIRLFRILFDN